MNHARRLAFAAILALSVAVPAGGALPDVSALATSGASAGRPAAITPRPTGEVNLVVRLADPPLAAVVGSKRTGFKLTAAQQQAYAQQLAAKQAALMSTIRGMGGRELARVSRATNALVIAIDASRTTDLAKIAGVASVREVMDYRLQLSETVPYIGATALQNLGLTGAGVTVAVIDSGIDYTHRNLGGPGTTAAYAAAYGASPADPKNKTRDGLFPTPKVIAGFDFVGEEWPGTAQSPKPLAPDPDPIDFGGHGTHVADIIAGKSADGTHKGVAPDARLMALKNCSAVATSCSGVGLLQAIDFALDPNGDFDLSDAADVINLSQGVGYGQREDDQQFAVANAVRMGVVVVVSAGNDADKPFIMSTPAATPETISVAQTQVPSAEGIPLVINAPPAIAGVYGNTATLDYAPIGAGVTGNVAFVGPGCPADATTTPPTPEDAYLANPAGKIALIDRGSCNVSLKIDRAAKAGAIGVLIGLVAPGDAVGFSFGGGTSFVPTLVITQSVSNAIKTQLAGGQTVNVTMSEANAIALVGSIVNTSSRGPSYSYAAIKPDIGAPGGSLSAEVGTGTGQTVFSGTSGAAPMVSGSAALLLQAYPTATPLEIKARLMNSAERNVFTSQTLVPGELAPISRVGAGEVRVNRAFGLGAAAWDAVDTASVGLSFGYAAITGTQVLRKKVTVRNYQPTARTFAISSSFRYANDQASGAVAIAAPPTVTVPANGSATFQLALTVNASKLPTWGLNGGSSGGTGRLLQTVEFDGFVRIADAQDTLTLPWHLLPHKAANTRAASSTVALNGASSGVIPLTNPGGAVPGRVEVFSLTGTSDRIPSELLPLVGENFTIADLKAVGVRLVPAGGTDFAVQFGIGTYGHRAHPAYPAEFDVFIDTNGDGKPDYIIFTSENGTFFSTGQTVVTVQKIPPVTTPPTPPTFVTRFFADADLESGNIILTALLSDLGLTPASKFTFFVAAFDNYFTGNPTDVTDDMTVTLGTPRFSPAAAAATVPINGTVNLPFTRIPAGDAASPSQTGLLLLYRDAKPGAEAQAITITP